MMVPAYKDVVKYTLSVLDPSVAKTESPWKGLGMRGSVEECKTLAKLHQANFIVEEFEL